jgi:transposase InsO family protein
LGVGWGCKGFERQLTKKICVIPKLFPYGEFYQSMKFTQGKLMETIRRKNDGWTTYQARKIAGVSIRRVNQLYTQYLQTESLPSLGRDIGRPKKPISKQEIEIVKASYQKYKVSASTLERLIIRDFKQHIPHNKIHKIMIYLGVAKPKQFKDIRKKNWIRYERRHSLTAVHIDWHFCGKSRDWVFAVIDDASRKLLALIECDSPTTEKSIEGIIIALKHGKIRQCISDHGAQFIGNNGGGSRFVEFLKNSNIKQILCKIKHPQSNGKAEKFFDLYDRKRFCFDSMIDFIVWYNEVRPHKSLNFEALETPEQAFHRKMRAEA